MKLTNSIKSLQEQREHCLNMMKKLGIKNTSIDQIARHNIQTKLEEIDEMIEIMQRTLKGPLDETECRTILW